MWDHSSSGGVDLGQKQQSDEVEAFEAEGQLVDWAKGRLMSQACGLSMSQTHGQSMNWAH